MALYSDISSYTVWAKESVYGTAPATVNSQSGVGESANPEMENNLDAYYAIAGTRNPNQVQAGQADFRYSENFKMTNGAFLENVLGAVTGAGTGISPFSYSVSNTPPSLTVEAGFNTLTTARTLRFLGSYVNNCTISCKTKEPVFGTIDYLAYDLAKGTTFQSISAATTAYYMFENGTLESPTSSTIAEVVSVELNIACGVMNNDQIGERRIVRVPGSMKFTGTIKARVIDGYWMDKFLTGGTSATGPTAGNPTAVATMRLNLTRGSSYIYLVLTNVRVKNWKGSMQRGALIDQDIQIEAEGCTATEVT